MLILKMILKDEDGEKKIYGREDQIHKKHMNMKELELISKIESNGLE